jgi:site-specific DNA-methyltransferase (adenine-specific)
VRSRKIDRVEGATLKDAIRENVGRLSRIVTDEWATYRVIGSEFVGGHAVLTHFAGEYAANLQTSCQRLTVVPNKAKLKATRMPALAKFSDNRQNEPLVDRLITEDSVMGLKELPSDYAHLILSDIPYGIGFDQWDVLHENTNSAFLGSSPAQEKAGKIFRKRGKPINGWSPSDRSIPRQYQEWCATWAREWHRILKPGGSAIIFAGRRFAHRCICALEDVDFSFKDMLAWKRDRAPHRAQRVSVVFERRGDLASAKKWEGWRVGNLRPLFEPILWFTKPYKIGATIASNALEHDIGPFNEDAFCRYVDRPDNILDLGFTPGEAGLHPTQKPVLLLQALIELTTLPGHIVLDPFAGSGSTLIAARNTARHFIGYEIDPEFAAICQNRLESDLFTVKK